MTGLEQACQLLVTSAQNRGFIPCRLIFDMLGSDSSGKCLEQINEVLSAFSLCAMRIKHKGIYCFTIVDNTSHPETHYQWLRETISAEDMRALDEERGAYILVRILLHVTEFESELEDLITLLAETTSYPLREQNAVELEPRAESPEKRHQLSAAKEVWRDLLTDFISMGWLQQKDSRISCLNELSQKIISEEAISRFIDHRAKEMGERVYNPNDVLYKFNSLTSHMNGA